MSKFEIGYTGAAGRVEAQVLVRDESGKLVPKEGAGAYAKCDNIITSRGLAYLKPSTKDPLIIPDFRSNGDVYINIGTGTQPETESVTQLAQYSRSLGSRHKDFTRDYVTVDGVRLVVETVTHVFLFPPDPGGVARTYTEVGLGSSSSSRTSIGNASTHALDTYTLFKNPVTGIAETVTVLGDEYLSISYTYQTQWELLSGFTANMHPIGLAGYPRTDTVIGHPFGPIPLSGEGFPPDTVGYVLLDGGGLYTSTTLDYGGVYYFDETTLDKEALWDAGNMMPPSEANSGWRGYADYYSQYLFNSWSADNIATGYRYSMRYPEERRPLCKNTQFTVTPTSRVLPPGTLTKDKPIKVVGCGDVGSGGILLFSKPITITKDSKFEIPRDLRDLWEFKTPVNAPFIETE